MAEIRLQDDDVITFPSGRVVSGRIVNRIILRSVEADDDGRDIVRIDGMVHNVNATRRALELFDAVRAAFK